MISDAFFSGWMPLARTLLLTILAYPALLLILRMSGHRTLAKLNAFDLVITVALGSTLASIITSSTVSLAQGALAFSLLALLQFVVAKATVRSQKVENLVNGEAVLLYHRGDYLYETMRRERITEEEVQSAVRSEGLTSIDEAEAVVLETNGSLSVVRRDGKSPSSLRGVRGFEQRDGKSHSEHPPLH